MTLVPPPSAGDECAPEELRRLSLWAQGAQLRRLIAQRAGLGGLLSCRTERCTEEAAGLAAGAAADLEKRSERSGKLSSGLGPREGQGPGIPLSCGGKETHWRKRTIWPGWGEWGGEQSVPSETGIAFPTLRIRKAGKPSFLCTQSSVCTYIYLIQVPRASLSGPLFSAAPGKKRETRLSFQVAQRTIAEPLRVSSVEVSPGSKEGEMRELQAFLSPSSSVTVLPASSGRTVALRLQPLSPSKAGFWGWEGQWGRKAQVKPRYRTHAPGVAQGPI